MHLALRSIVEGTATATGTEFFYALVRELAQALNVLQVFVAELLESKTRVRTLALWFGGQLIDNIEFDLDGTPCEVVIRGETVYYTHKVYDVFPQNTYLKEVGIESYFGVPLVSESGHEMMGHLAVCHNQPMVKEFRGMALLRIFAARARAELERKRAEQALRKSEERLASVLASAMDAIITLDSECCITLFNPAAEKVFRCPATQVIGQPFEPFLSKRFGNLLKGYCLAVQPATVNSQQLWAPEGLTARRYDGEEFPVEATLSPLEIEGRRFFTVILRDVTERWQSEETLEQLQLEKVYLQEEIKTRLSPSHIVGDSTGGVRLRRAGGGHRFHRALDRRNRYRQKRDRPDDSRLERPAGQAVRTRQLRHLAGRFGGKRTVRPRKRRVHRRDHPAQGPFRTGRRRHPVPGRGRRVDCQRPG
jgi:PAS domain S-box-containing protein